MNKFVEVLKNPLWIIVFFNNRGFHFLNDEKFIKLLYKLTLKRQLDLEHPKTFNEKLQWLKLHDRKPQYTKMVDKYEVKKYVASIIGNKHIIPTLGIYNKFDDINFDILPNHFVMKCTHDSGGILIVKDKDKLNIKAERKKFNKLLRKNFYYSSREWPYKNVSPRIIIEKYMVNKGKEELNDYKIFCFNGEPKIVLVCSERFSSSNMCKTFFDTNWKIFPFTENNHRVNKNVKKPETLNMMIEYSKKLSKNIPFVRIDWYEIEGKLYFGEITFYPSSGFEKFEPLKWDYEFGNWIKID